jgi:hypothetical protein
VSTRARFAFGALVPAVIIIAIVVITAGGSSKPKPPPPAKLPVLVQSYASPSVGIRGQLPRDWSALRGPGFVRLTNHDGTAVIAIAVPNTQASAHALLNSTLATVRKTYKSVTVKAGRGTSLGGLPARSEIVYTTNQRGVPIRILLAAARGPHLRYILEAFTNQNAPLHDLVETQQIVIALRLTG